jgi:hypothetical protein
MRFLDSGADIPDELVREVVEGGAVFLCGAGVSRRVGLPSFRQLTERIYEALGESPANEAAEQWAMDRDEFDRALRSLEKRTHRPKTQSPVRLAAAKLLEAKGTEDLSDHIALLQLSRDADGHPRLLTTNFDLMFERAADNASVYAPSHAGKAIPKPGGERDVGILHLHGRIGDDDLGIEASDLILTSADFGDAYLRDGWTSRYIEDRMRLGTLVLVGYGAEDAALRLLLEALDADRERFPDLKDIYAIVKHTSESTSMWNAKGIKPIEFKEYADIYATLSEWAKYAMEPNAYRDAVLESILGGPSGSS